MPYDSQITRSDAEALIPEEVTREIIRSLPATSAAFSLMRRTTMSAKQQRQPALTALAQAYWVGGDTGLKQTTKLAWANKYLIAEELAAIVPVPLAVLDDADYPIWDEVRPQLVEAAGALIDAAVLFGVGKPASWPAAIVTAADAAGNEWVAGSVANTDRADDFNSLFGLVEGDGFVVNGVAAQPTLKGTLRGLRNADGTFVFIPNAGSGGEPIIFGERAAYINNGAWDGAAALAIAGDWSQAILGVRQDFTFTVHTEGVISDDAGNIILNLMQQDSAAIRMVMRVGYVTANPISRLAPVEASRYPFSVLRPVGFI